MPSLRLLLDRAALHRPCLLSPQPFARLQHYGSDVSRSCCSHHDGMGVHRRAVDTLSLQQQQAPAALTHFRVPLQSRSCARSRRSDGADQRRARGGHDSGASTIPWSTPEPGVCVPLGGPQQLGYHHHRGSQSSPPHRYRSATASTASVSTTTISSILHHHLHLLLHHQLHPRHHPRHRPPPFPPPPTPPPSPPSQHTDTDITTTTTVNATTFSTPPPSPPSNKVVPTSARVRGGKVCCSACLGTRLRQPFRPPHSSSAPAAALWCHCVSGYCVGYACLLSIVYFTMV